MLYSAKQCGLTQEIINHYRNLFQQGISHYYCNQQLRSIYNGRKELITKGLL